MGADFSPFQRKPWEVAGLSGSKESRMLELAGRRSQGLVQDRPPLWVMRPLDRAFMMLFGVRREQEHLETPPVHSPCFTAKETETQELGAAQDM